MIELYVLATLSAMGYLLNKSSTSVNNKSNVVNANEIPSQDSIYASNRVEQVKRIEERKAARMHARSKDPSNTNVVSMNYGAMKADFKPESKKIRSLTGDYIDTESFTHNNMVPFFGGNIKQNLDDNSTKSILENFTGVSDVFKNKQEVACMSDKSKDFGYVNGMANQDDFYRERMVESRNRNNVVPIPQIRVGPGLNQGYDATPTGGFQQFDAQDVAMSMYKPVDELRVSTKPKLSFEARTIDGQKEKLRAEAPNLAKNRVETFYEKNPDMLFKTTGAYTKPTEIPEFNVKATHRLETTREEIGIAGTGGTVFMRKLDEQNVKPTSRQQLKEYGIRNTSLNTYGKGEKDDFGKSQILVYNNERDITTTRVYQGNVTSLIKAIVAPLQDVMRINKKEHAVDNPRHFGNMNAQVPEKPTMYDPNDIARTTIKETLLHDEMGTGTVTGPKKLMVYDPEEVAKKTIRETVERMDYEMNLGTGVSKGVVYDPEDVARTTMKETLVEETHDANINALEGMGTYVNDYFARNTQKQFISDMDYYGAATHETQDGAYKTTKYDARNTHKQFTSDNDYFGVSGSAYNKKAKSKEDMNNAVITARKEVTLFGREPTQEGRKMANGGECLNLGVRKVECDIASKRNTNNVDRVVSKIPDSTTLNITRDRLYQQVPDDRLDPSLLSAFHENPYTQPLTSAF